MKQIYQTDIHSDKSHNTCYWCKSEIITTALRCPNCRMWRMDIYEGKVLTYTFMIIWLIHFITGLYYNFWGEILLIWPFTLKMITSFNGWINLILLGTFWIIYIRTSRKIGTFWWV